MHDNVLLVLLGAGASHGAQRKGLPSTQAYAPVTEELFGPNYRDQWATYTPCLGLADSVRDWMAHEELSFEEAVGASYDALEHDEAERDRRVLALRLYLRSVE